MDIGCAGYRRVDRTVYSEEPTTILVLYYVLSDTEESTVS